MAESRHIPASGPASSIGWHFPRLDGGSYKSAVDAAQEYNKGSDVLDNLARETIQNSLDAARSYEDPSYEGPVRVEFTLSEMEANLPFLKDYRTAAEHALALNEHQGFGAKDKTHQFLEKVDELLGGTVVSCLTVSDYGTTGAMGEGFVALAHSKGHSRNKRGGGGSFGIGKAAAESYSQLSLVLYATKGFDGTQLFEAKGQLSTFIDEDGVERDAEGHYVRMVQVGANLETHPLTPADGNSVEARFRREEVGTDVIIVGVEREPGFMEKLTRAVIANCLVALYDGRLEVVVNDGMSKQLINAGTLPALLKGFTSPNLRFYREWYACLQHADLDAELTLLEPGDARVRMCFNASYSNWTGIFKRNGMLLCRLGYSKDAPHAALVELTGRQASNLMLQSEDPSHRKWDSRRIQDKDARKVARRLQGEIRDAVRNAVLEQANRELGEEVDSGEEAFSEAPQSLGKGLLSIVADLSSSMIEIFFPPLHSGPSRASRRGASGGGGAGVGGQARGQSETQGAQSHDASPREASPSTGDAPLRLFSPEALEDDAEGEDLDVFEQGEGRRHQVIAATRSIHPDAREPGVWHLSLMPTTDCAKARLRLLLATSEGRGTPVRILRCEDRSGDGVSADRGEIDGNAMIVTGLKEHEPRELKLWLDMRDPVGAFVIELKGA